MVRLIAAQELRFLVHVIFPGDGRIGCYQLGVAVRSAALCFKHDAIGPH